MTYVKTFKYLEYLNDINGTSIIDTLWKLNEMIIELIKYYFKIFSACHRVKIGADRWNFPYQQSIFFKT